MATEKSPNYYRITEAHEILNNNRDIKTPQAEADPERPFPYQSEKFNRLAREVGRTIQQLR